MYSENNSLFKHEANFSHWPVTYKVNAKLICTIWKYLYAQKEPLCHRALQSVVLEGSNVGRDSLGYLVPAALEEKVRGKAGASGGITDATIYQQEKSSETFF